MKTLGPKLAFSVCVKRPISSCVIALFLLGMARHAQADSALGPEYRAQTAPPRPFDSRLYFAEAQIPPAGQVSAIARGAFTTASGPLRALADDLGHAKWVEEFGAEAGLTRGVSFGAVGYIVGGPPDDARQSGMMAGLKWAGVAPFDIRVAISSGILVELGGSHGAWSRLSLSKELGRARVSTTLQAAHIFSPGRDDADVTVFAGASYGVVGPLRLGIESFARDLEELAPSHAAEHGMGMAAGPTLELELLQRSLWIGAGPSVGLSSSAPSTLGRFAMSYAF